MHVVLKRKSEKQPQYMFRIPSWDTYDREKQCFWDEMCTHEQYLTCLWNMQKSEYDIIEIFIHVIWNDLDLFLIKWKWYEYVSHVFWYDMDMIKLWHTYLFWIWFWYDDTIHVIWLVPPWYDMSAPTLETKWSFYVFFPVCTLGAPRLKKGSSPHDTAWFGHRG